MTNLTVSRNYFQPQPIVDFTSLQNAKKNSEVLKRLGWYFEMIGRAGLFVTSYQVLEYGFRAFHLRSTLISLAVSITGLALSRLHQQMSIAHLAGLTPEKEFSIHLDYYKQYLRDQPVCETGVKGYLVIRESLSLDQQRELLDLAYTKGIILTFSQHKVSISVTECWKSVDDFKNKYKVTYQQMTDSFICMAEFIQRRLTHAKKVKNPDDKELDVAFIQQQVKALGLRWAAKDPTLCHTLHPPFNLWDKNTIALGASAYFIGSGIVRFIKFFAIHRINMRIVRAHLGPMDHSYLQGDTSIISTLHRKHLSYKDFILVFKLMADQVQDIELKKVSPSAFDRVCQQENWEEFKTFLRTQYPAVSWRFIENELLSESQEQIDLPEADVDQAYMREQREQLFGKEYVSRRQADQVENTNDE